MCPIVLRISLSANSEYRSTVFRAQNKLIEGWEGIFLNSRFMDDLFLKRVNSWQGIIKKEQESIFEKSVGSLRNLQFFLKMRFRNAPVLSNDP